MRSLSSRLILLGRADSLNVRKVLWALSELGLAYERHDFGGPYGGTQDAAYRALNPTGLVPTLLHDGNAIWESNTIVRYLGEVAAAKSFLGATPAERAGVSRWMDWQLDVAATAVQPLFHQLVRTTEGERDLALIDRKIGETVAAMRVLDGALPTTTFVGGETVTAADCALGVYVHRYHALAIPRPALSRVESYLRALRDRPGFRQHVAIGVP